MASPQKVQIAINDLRKRSKADLLEVLEAMLPENDELVPLLTTQERLKSTARLVTIREQLATIHRLKKHLSQAIAQRTELANLCPEPIRPQWLKDIDARRAEAKARASKK